MRRDYGKNVENHPQFIVKMVDNWTSNSQIFVWNRQKQCFAHKKTSLFESQSSQKRMRVLLWDNYWGYDSKCAYEALTEQKKLPQICSEEGIGERPDDPVRKQCQSFPLIGSSCTNVLASWQNRQLKLRCHYSGSCTKVKVINVNSKGLKIKKLLAKQVYGTAHRKGNNNLHDNGRHPVVYEVVFAFMSAQGQSFSNIPLAQRVMILQQYQWLVSSTSATMILKRVQV